MLFRPKMSKQSLNAYEAICIMHIMCLLNKKLLTNPPKMCPEFFTSFIASRPKTGIFNPENIPEFLIHLKSQSEGSNHSYSRNSNTTENEKEVKMTIELKRSVDLNIGQRVQQNSQMAPMVESQYSNLQDQRNQMNNQMQNKFANPQNYVNPHVDNKILQNLDNFKAKNQNNNRNDHHFRPELRKPPLQTNNITNIAQKRNSQVDPPSNPTQKDSPESIEVRKNFEIEFNRALNEQKNLVEQESDHRENILNQKRENNKAINDMIYYMEEKAKRVEQENSRLQEILDLCRQKCSNEIPQQIEEIGKELRADFQEQQTLIAQERQNRREDLSNSIEVINNTMEEIESLLKGQIAIRQNMANDWRRNIKLEINKVFDGSNVGNILADAGKEISRLKNKENELSQQMEILKTQKNIENREAVKPAQNSVEKTQKPEKFTSELKIENEFREVDLENIENQENSSSDPNYLENRREAENARKREESEMKPMEQSSQKEIENKRKSVEIDPFAMDNETTLNPEKCEANQPEIQNIEQNKKESNEEEIEEVKKDIDNIEKSLSSSDSDQIDQSENKNDEIEMKSNVLKDFNLEDIDSQKNESESEKIEVKENKKSQNLKKNKEKEKNDQNLESVLDTVKKEPPSAIPDFEFEDDSDQQIDSEEERRIEEEKMQNKPLLENNSGSQSDCDEPNENKNEKIQDNQNETSSKDLFEVTNQNETSQNKNKIESDDSSEDIFAQSGKNDLDETLETVKK